VPPEVKRRPCRTSPTKRASGGRGGGQAIARDQEWREQRGLVRFSSSRGDRKDTGRTSVLTFGRGGDGAGGAVGAVKDGHGHRHG
jgi:hypothetical protein